MGGERREREGRGRKSKTPALLTTTTLPPHSIMSIQPVDTGVDAGCLGLNAMQRRSLRVSSGDVVAAHPFRPPTDGSLDAALVQAEIDYVSRRPLPPKAPPVELDADEVAGHVSARFAGQVFSLNQAATFEFQGVNYTLKVTAIAAGHGGGAGPGGAVDAARGLLTPATGWVFDPAPGAGLALRGSRSTAPVLFKHKEVSFEKLGIGGLDAQFDAIFRRAFASRVFPPAVVERLGIKHVRGVLLHGPPGTGKTLIARQIGKMLNGREPKIVNGPEVLNKYVGASEENIRNLFKDAEDEQAARGSASDLHVIIFDEIDAICKQRGSVQSGAGVHDTVVNQLLTKIDGVDALDNILVIGMTNRIDMLDDALLRPGRFEVQVEVGLPDEAGRLQILKIHTARMAANSYLSPGVDLPGLARACKNFSGAEIEGLVKSAASFALSRAVDVSDLGRVVDAESVRVSAADFEAARAEVTPAFGAASDELAARVVNGMLDCGDGHRHLRATLATLVEQVRGSASTPLLTCLLEGAPGAGKTALASTLGLDCAYPLVRLISPDAMVGHSEAAKVAALAKAFDDAARSPLSLVIVDDIERLLEYVPIGPRFSNAILQALLVLLKKAPPPGRRLLVVGTTSEPGVMHDLGVAAAFNVTLTVPRLREPEMRALLTAMGAFAPGDVELAIASLMEPEVSVKRLLMLLEMARQAAVAASGDASGPIPVMVWNSVLRDLTTAG